MFEFFLNNPLIEKLTGEKIDISNPISSRIINIHAYAKCGYDYVTVGVGFRFKKPEIHPLWEISQRP